MDKTPDARRPADKTAKKREWFDHPTVKKMWAKRDTRLLLGAVCCGLFIKEGNTPDPVAVDYLRGEYSTDELRSAAAELDTDAGRLPHLADTCKRAAAFIREWLLQGREQA